MSFDWKTTMERQKITQNFVAAWKTGKHATIEKCSRRKRYMIAT